MLVELLAYRVSPSRWSRLLAGWVGLVTVANAGLWLTGIVPAVLGHRPQQVTDGLGVATNPVWVQDLGLWLPAAAVVGVALWRRRPWSNAAGAALTSFWVLESISIAVDQWFGAQADPTSAVVSSALVPGLLVLAAIGCLPALALLRATARWQSDDVPRR